MLERLYAAALLAARPGPATEGALMAAPPPSTPIHLIAIGKAAPAMARAAVDWLRRNGRTPSGGVIVGVDPPEDVIELPIEYIAGDHPAPGARSLRAADAIGRAAACVRTGDSVIVLLSGGASALAAAPVAGVTLADLIELNALLLGSGLAIGEVNSVRKRMLRWGAGRLAAAVGPASVRCLAVSDVIGNDPGTIGSGPCVPDARPAQSVIALLQSVGLWDRAPASVRSALSRDAHGDDAGTTGPGDRTAAGTAVEILLDNSAAISGAAAAAAAAGLTVVTDPPLSGDAAALGGTIARRLRGMPPGSCLVLGGETTVASAGAPGVLGGRCQELALAAARELAGYRVGLLAAGTDGRDGPTDAAGAAVDGATWPAITRAGRDPEADLAGHDAYRALDAVAALIRTGPTGTNVADIVIGLT